MPLISPAYRGPLVIFAVGVGFAAVGAVPVAINFSLGTRSSATIIGMGFVGFGFLLMLPGIFWCLMVRTHSFKTWRRRLMRRGRTIDEDGQGTDDDGERTPALHKPSSELNGQCDKATTTQRSKCWPPSYCDPPPLIITDYSVCRASTPTSHSALDDPEQPPSTAGEDPREAGEPLCHRTSPVVITVTTTTSGDDDVDDSQRLLSDLSHTEQQVDTVPTNTDSTVPLSINSL